MKTPRSRDIRRLHISVPDVDPPIWRALDVDESLTMAVLHDVLQLMFGWSGRLAHLFTSEEPQKRTPYESWCPPHRRLRWGNRWSMIEWRDPEVEDEASATVGDVFTQRPTMLYRYDPGSGWVLRLDAGEREADAVGRPPVQLIAGAGRAPFDDPNGPRGYAEMLRALVDPAHDQHEDAHRHVARQVGPWARFDPDDAEDTATRLLLERRFDTAKPAPDATTPVGWETHRSPLTMLLATMPPSARAGLIRHVEMTGALRPPLVTEDSAAELLRPYTWLIGELGPDGMTVDAERALPASVAHAAAVALGWNPVEARARLATLTASARRLGFIKLQRGKLCPTKAALTENASARELWNALARRVVDRLASRGRVEPVVLLLLAMADGSLEADPRSAIARIGAALALSSRDDAFDVGDLFGGLAYDHQVSPLGADTQASWAALYGPWGDEGSWGPERPPMFPPLSGEAVATAVVEHTRSRFDADARTARAALQHVVETLGPLGLDASGEAWTITPQLRELAHHALQRPKKSTFAIF